MEEPKPKWWWLKWVGLGAVMWTLIITALSRVPSPEPSPDAQPMQAAAPAVDSVAMAVDTAMAVQAQAQPARDTVQQAAQPAAQPAAHPPATTPEPQRDQAPPPQKKQEKEVTVYVTRTGDHYHRSGCSSLRKSKYPMDLSEARNSYEPCHRCRPPR